MENLRPFNQEEFDAGCPAVTRNGIKVLEVYTFRSDIENPLRALLETGNVLALRRDGKYYENATHHYDIFMAPKMKIWHYCICRDKDTKQPWISGLHASKEIMEDRVNVIDNEIIQTFEIEIEDEEPKTV